LSIICWDGKKLAADRRATSGNLSRSIKKISRHGDILIGGTGVWSSVEAIRNWVLLGCNPREFPKVPESDQSPCLWVINRNGTIVKFEDSPFPIQYTDTVFAEGSGRDFAYGALAMGACAQVAVGVACMYDVNCGGAIDVLTFE
jgi:hypothetical protein